MAPPRIHDTCTFDDCTSPHHAKGLCRAHYQQSLRGSLHGVSEYKAETDVCAAPGCDNMFHQRLRGQRRLYCSRVCRDRVTKQNMRAAGWVEPHLRPNAPRCAVDGCDLARMAKSFCAMHYNRFRKYGDPGPAESFHNPGEWRLDSNGYRRRSMNGQSQLEHRVVMEQLLDRPLLPHENVHHINGDRADNRPENLELWSSWQPSGQRVADKLAWAHEIIALYEGGTTD